MMGQDVPATRLRVLECDASACDDITTTQRSSLATSISIEFHRVQWCSGGQSTKAHFLAMVFQKLLLQCQCQYQCQTQTHSQRKCQNCQIQLPKFQISKPQNLRIVTKYGQYFGQVLDTRKMCNIGQSDNPLIVQAIFSTVVFAFSNGGLSVDSSIIAILFGSQGWHWLCYWCDINIGFGFGFGFGFDIGFGSGIGIGIQHGLKHQFHEGVVVPVFGFGVATAVGSACMVGQYGFAFGHLASQNPVGQFRSSCISSTFRHSFLISLLVGLVFCDFLSVLFSRD